MTDVPAIRSPKYQFVTRLRRVQRRDLIWVSADRRGQWVIIPQRFSNLRPYAGEHCLVHDRKLICRLRESQGYHDQLVLIGRDGAGADWLCYEKGDRDQSWALMQRGGSPSTDSPLPDGVLAGATSDTGVERLVAAALVLGGVRFDTSSDLIGRPDLIIPERRLAIFAHGCHHHAHGCARCHGYGQQMTRAEIEDVRAHDARVIAALNEAGWSVLTVWECAVGRGAEPAPEDFVGRLVEAVREAAPTAEISARPG